MRKVLVAGIVGINLLTGCVSMAEIEARNEEAKIILKDGEIISSVPDGRGLPVHTVKYKGQLYDCKRVTYDYGWCNLIS